MDVDEREFREWAAARSRTMHRTAYLLCGDWHVAEDLVQEALARTALHWRRVQRAEHPDAYIRKILVNEATRRWRRRSTHERPAERLPEQSAQDSAHEFGVRDELMTALRALPRRQRAAVVLRYFDQLSEAETARALDCSTGTVKSQTSRALTALRHSLTNQEAPCTPTT